GLTFVLAAEYDVHCDCRWLAAIDISNDFGPNGARPWPAPQFFLKQRIAGVVDIDDYDPGVGCLVPSCPTRPDVVSAILQPFPDATERKAQRQQSRNTNARIDSPSKRALGVSLVVHVGRKRT